MKKVSVKNDKVVVEVEGGRISHDMATIQHAISRLEQDLSMWRDYERLLTQHAVDAPYSDEIMCVHDRIEKWCPECRPLSARH